MFEQFNTQMSFLSKNAADALLKAQGIALEGFEKMLDLQFKTIENRVHAAVEFFNEAATVRDADGFKSIWPKGVALVKESAEKAFGTSQEIVAISLKTSEAYGEVIKGSVEAANDTIAKVKTAPKAAAAK